MADGGRVDSLVDVFTAHSALAAVHRPGRFDGDMLYFAATGAEPWRRPPPEVWAPHVTGTVETRHVPCRHGERAGRDALVRIGPVVAAHLDDRSPRREEAP